MKSVPNPAYATAKYEAVATNKNGKVVRQVRLPTRGNTIKDGVIVYRILPHVLVSDDGSPLAKPTKP